MHGWKPDLLGQSLRAEPTEIFIWLCEKLTDCLRKCFSTRDIWVDFKQNICQLIHWGLSPQPTSSDFRGRLGVVFPHICEAFRDIREKKVEIIVSTLILTNVWMIRLLLSCFANWDSTLMLDLSFPLKTVLISFGLDLCIVQHYFKPQNKTLDYI